MVDIMREWFESRLGKRVRLTRRAALSRDEVHEFAVYAWTFYAHGDRCNVITPHWLMCYGTPRNGAIVLDGKLHCHVISFVENHFFDVYEDA